MINVPERRWLWVGLKLTVSIALMGGVLYTFGGDAAGKALARGLNADPSWLAAAVALAMVQVLLCTLRWRAVLFAIDADLPFVPALKYWFIGAFFNQALPSGAGGDAVRGYMAFKHGVGLPAVLSSLFLDRAATVLALVVLVAVMTPFGAEDLKNGVWFARIVWLVLAVSVTGLALVMVLDRLPRALLRFRLVRAGHYLAGDARRVLLHPLNAGRLMLWSVLGHVNLVLVIYALFRALDVEVTVVQCLLLFPPVLLAQVLPLTIAGWGVREGAMVALFALAQVPMDAALAVSVLFGLVVALTSLPGAALWLGAGVGSLKGASKFVAESKN